MTAGTRLVLQSHYTSVPYRAYALHLSRSVFEAQRKFELLCANSRTVVASLLSEVEDLTQQIVDIKIRIRLLQKGHATDESIDCPQQSEVLDSTLTDAERYLLKKAYRTAAALAHPDKGGSSEEFQSVYNAYKAGDVYALNAYVMSRNSGPLGSEEVIAFWLKELERLRVLKTSYLVTNEHSLATLVMRGRRSDAMQWLQRELASQLRSLLAEEYLLISRQP